MIRIRRGLDLAALVAVVVAFSLIIGKNIPAEPGARLLNLSDEAVQRPRRPALFPGLTAMLCPENILGSQPIY